MWHNKAFRKLGRKHQHRMATLRALSTALFQRERIQTTLMKAKELRPFAEKLITRSKRDDLHARRQVLRHIQDQTVAKKLFDTLSARYMERNGGYMRILKLGRRQGDGAEMALVELLGSEPVFKKKEEEPKKKAGMASRLLGRRKKPAPSDHGDHGDHGHHGEPEEGEGPETAEAAQPTAARGGKPKKKTPAKKKPAAKPKSKPAGSTKKKK